MLPSKRSVCLYTENQYKCSQYTIFNTNVFFTIKVSKSLGTRMNKKLLLCVLNFYFQLGYFSKDKDNLKFPDNQKDLSESISFGTPKNISILFRI